jgi:hypothetical protein
MALDFNGGGAISPFSAADMNYSAFADTVALTRKFHRQIMERIPDANYLKDGLLEDVIAGGGMLGVASDTVNVYHAEQESVVSNIKVIAKAAVTGATNKLTLTIDGESIGSKYFIYALVGQIFSTNSNNVQIVVESVSTTLQTGNDYNIVVAAPVGTALTSYIAADDVLRPLGGTVGPNSDFGTGSVRGWSRFGVNFQTQETVAGPLPTNAYNQTFEFTMGNGQNVLAPRVLLDAYVRDDLKKMAQIIVGTGDTFLNAAGESMPTTMGIFKTIQTYGQTGDYTKAALTWDAFLTINDYLRNRGAGTERDLWLGAKVFDTIQINFKTDFDLALRYVNADGNLGDAHTNFGVGFAQFASSEVTYTMKRMNELSHPRIFSNATNVPANAAALANQYYANCFMILPTTKVKIQNGLSSRTQAVEAPMMRILQLEAPVTVGGPKVMKRVYNQAGAELGKENYRVTMRQDFALQMMLAYKCYFGGFTAA